VAVPLGVVAAVGVLAAWIVRPNVQTMWRKTPFSLTGHLQSGEGVPVQPLRSYAEESINWLSWYLGPLVVALAAVGLGVLVAGALRGTRRYWVLLAVVVTALPVLWDPRITPNQLWAMRRLLPIALPLFAVMAALAAAMIVARLSPRVGWQRLAISVVAAGIIVAAPVVVTRPQREKSDQLGFLTPVLAACNEIGDDPVVVIGSNGETLPPALRGWCGSPTVRGTSEVTEATLRRLSREWNRRGRPLWVVAATPDEIVAVMPDAEPEFVGAVRNDRAFPISVTRPPLGQRTTDLSIAAALVPPG
jgi:hypothetical protein